MKKDEERIRKSRIQIRKKQKIDRVKERKREMHTGDERKEEKLEKRKEIRERETERQRESERDIYKLGRESPSMRIIRYTGLKMSILI